MKKPMKLIALLLALTLFATITACGQRPAPSDAPETAQPTDTTQPETAAPETAQPTYDQVTINVNGTTSGSNPIAMAFLDVFEPMLEERSGGAVQVEVFLNATFGTGTASIESMQSGAVQAGECTLSSYAGFCPDVQYTAVPFTFNNREEAYAWTQTDVAARLKEKVLESTGIHLLSWFENGIRELSNSKREVRTPADLAGMKMRVMDSPAYIEMFTEMGTLPVPMTYSEIYTALQQGVCDGDDNPYSIFVSTKFYEVQKYETNLSHTFDFTAFGISDEFLQSLNEDTRNLILAVGLETEQYQHECAAAQEQINIQTIQDNGVQMYFLTDEERQAFKDCVAGFEDWFKTHVKATITWDEFQASVAEAKANA
ncbi:MAG: TRAP transporter substrate-binding protein [Oscillospiraceae bacterium]|nr:TRAP transporter substrate-binding protein [Oscillospiraceae bacterium]